MADLEMENGARKEGALDALEELKLRLHAKFNGGLERCNHINDVLALVFWLQHQIKNGEVEFSHDD